MFCFCNSPAATEIYTYLHTLSLHDAFPILTGKVNWPCAGSPSGQTIVRLPERDSPAASASTGTVASSTCWPLDALRTNMRSEKPAGVGRLPLLVVVQFSVTTSPGAHPPAGSTATPDTARSMRWEELRGGKGCCSTFSSGWSTYP